MGQSWEALREAGRAFRRWVDEWRASPRPVWWQGQSRTHFLLPVLASMAWVTVAQGAWAVVTGGADPSGGRGLAAAVYTLVSLLVAAATSALIYLYLRRPAEPRTPWMSPAGPDEQRLRDEAERLRWAPKAPHGDL